MSPFDNMKTFRFIDDQFEKKEITHTRKVVRAIVVNSSFQIALIHIKCDDSFGHRDYYETPGGGMEKGENRYASLRREILEEVGVSIKNIHFLARVIDYYNLINRENDNYYYLCFVDEIYDTHLTDYEKTLFDSLVWVDIDSAIELYEKSNLTPIAHLVYQREMPILLLAKQYLENIKRK